MTHPFFHNGFRPFFLGGSLFAALAVWLWIAVVGGLLPSSQLYSPLDWHAHEMVFGFFGAILGGFLLTAIPNWTNRPPLAGGHLQLLFGLWLAGRAAMLAFLWGNPDHAATALAVGAVDLLYPLMLVVYTARQVATAQAIHNLPVVVMVGLVGTGNALFHLAPLLHIDRRFGPHLGIAVAAALIALIGGRVIPNFTRNWLASRPNRPVPAPFGKYDVVTLVLTVAALVGWLFAPEQVGVSVLLAVAGAAGLVRLWRWRGIYTGAEPLVLILHLGFLWLVIGLAFLPISLHALTTGAIGVMVLAIMTRASRGHTGRPLTADRTTVAIYVLVNAGAALRVAAPYLPLDYSAALTVAAIVWSAAFLLFAISYGPWLLKDRL